MILSRTNYSVLAALAVHYPVAVAPLQIREDLRRLPWWRRPWSKGALAARLTHLVSLGYATRTVRYPTVFYTLTPRGLALLPTECR